MKENKVKIGIYGLTGCAGDQLTILNCENEVVDIFQAADITSFIMAKSDNLEGKMDVALVEGSVSTRKDKEELLDIRERAGTLVAIGLCACAGGVQAAFLDKEEWAENYKRVYGDIEMSHTSPCHSKPLSAYVKVDYCIPGCPISAEQLLPTFVRMLGLNPPELSNSPVCMECKWNENDCLLQKGLPCLGPLTAAGCGAICPSHNLPCVGCWGPAIEPNRNAMFNLLLQKGFDAEFIKHKMASFSGTKIDEFMKNFKEAEK